MSICKRKPINTSAEKAVLHWCLFACSFPCQNHRIMIECRKWFAKEKYHAYKRCHSHIPRHPALFGWTYLCKVSWWQWNILVFQKRIPMGNSWKQQFSEPSKLCSNGRDSDHQRSSRADYPPMDSSHDSMKLLPLAGGGSNRFTKNADFNKYIFSSEAKMTGFKVIEKSKSCCGSRQIRIWRSHKFGEKYRLSSKTP